MTDYWVGVKQLAAALDKIAAEYETATKAALVASAAIVEKHAKANFQGSHRRGEPHTGGNKPNIVTGTLRRSITFTPPHRDGIASWSTTIAPHTVYARRVELGYPGGGGRGHARTRPFPYFEPAVHGSRDEIQARYAAVMRTVRG